MVEVKFCGVTREVDASEAARLGARYVGVIMTESPRRVSPDRAAQLRSTLQGTSARTVGVFGNESVEEILLAVSVAGVEVIQLHGARPSSLTPHPALSGASSNEPSAEVKRLQTELGVEIWRVIRVGANGLGEADRSAVHGAGGILLDSMTAGGALGGSGVAFDWNRVAPEMRALRVGRRFILAGGLRAENVRHAIDALAPDVVDVSSGVESAPGVKDHQRMAAFMTSVSTEATEPLR